MSPAREVGLVLMEPLQPTRLQLRDFNDNRPHAISASELFYPPKVTPPLNLTLQPNPPQTLA